MRFGFVALFLGLTALVTGQSVPVNDWLVVPGVRVGPITATTVRADMKRLFPQSTVAEDELELDEGMVFPATMVARETQTESLAIVWTGKAADAHPKQVFMCRGRRRVACNWHAVGVGGDIAPGVKLLDLETMNGKPFTIHGFGWGYGGNVESWDGGRMEKLDCHRSLSIALDGERGRDGEFTTQLTDDEKISFSGNRSVSTTTPALRKLNPAVTEILFIFPAGDLKACGPASR
jgi:hypothetical protein